jgi:hypothetical protein
MTSLLSLPDEILEFIFLHLEAKDVTKCSQTCKRLAVISLSETIWRRLVKVKFPTVVEYIIDHNRYGCLGCRAF